ncbi:MAG: radical SAM family heme chaperone HemW [Schleiferiaceae bacterium]|jgi:oxygen-independent coproporphyrinogen-3 oxidase|nr:radical SAM family heme chaperone HemW [Schleiferiaceae bacterium]MDG1313660.1 radical SAM family heme chaperone HemW [Schleiferiaceae bacterium]MDG1919332.1 radical SAM family heme chaperone HemW [Schleiferiaceae bacterium]MDG2110402.1 radical SAM family heme chaperone HemW [Schleiferiaceae bacterium]
MNETTLYLHIPYCKQACHYCDFHFSTHRSTESAVLEAMHAEMTMRSLQMPWNGAAINSLYFGGGTPSFLAVTDLSRLIDEARSLFSFSPSIEITLEANPDDITPEKLEAWHSIGITRLSIGLQSFNNLELQSMNRAHDASHSVQCLEWIADGPIQNYSVDFMYGMPGSTVESWKRQLDQLATYLPPHLSCYALTVEEKTVLYHDVRSGNTTLPSDEVIVAQFEALRAWASPQGYTHYELSNFAQPDKYSRHNSHYWSGQSYLGIGPGAHSFDGEKRWWNISNNTLYAQGAKVPSERLTLIDLLNERLMVRLRTAKGFLWEGDVPVGLDHSLLKRVKRNVQTAEAKGLVTCTDKGFAIPPDRWMQSDAIISELFLSPKES